MQYLHKATIKQLQETNREIISLSLQHLEHTVNKDGQPTQQ